MEAKPLNPQQRLKMEDLLTLDFDYADGFSVADIQALLSAERYWREAVKQSQTETSPICAFCQRWSYSHPHKPDCAWLRAQEEE